MTLAAGAVAAPAQGASASKTSAKPADYQHSVFAVENALSGAGYDVKANGVMDADTRKALQAYQNDQQLKPTGKINQATKTALGVGIFDELAAERKAAQKSEEEEDEGFFGF